MKKSIKRLPKRTQEELAILQELILQYISEVRMIILFGSYARGNYVLWEEGYDFGGVRYSYQSDLDILVIAGTGKPMKAEAQADKFVTPRYHKRLVHRRHPEPQIVVENPETMDKMLRRKQFFFSDIIKEGILLYNDEKYQLPKPITLPYREIKEIAQDEYEGCYPDALRYLKHAYIDKEDAQYKVGSFELHQTCERFYCSLLLVYINYRPKMHKLDVLAAMTKSFSRELACVFPQNTPEEVESYKKLLKAYIEARYNRHFTVSKEQFDYMLERTEVLRELTARLCAERLNFYEAKAQEEEEGK